MVSARKRVRRARLTRDRVLFLLGLTILLYQLFAAIVGRPIQGELVTAGLALLLAPAAYRLDDANKDRKEAERSGVDR